MQRPAALSQYASAGGWCGAVTLWFDGIVAPRRATARLVKLSSPSPHKSPFCRSRTLGWDTGLLRHHVFMEHDARFAVTCAPHVRGNVVAHVQLTYSAMAEQLGTSFHAARMWANRRKLPKITDAQGRAVVLVDSDDLNTFRPGQRVL